MKNILLLLILLTGFSSQAMAVTISAQTDRNPVHLNETFNLTFEADGSPDDDPDFTPLDNDFEIINQNQSSNISILNGKYTKKIQWSLTVMAKRAGTITVPVIHFGKDSSRTIRMSVKKDSPKAGNSKSDVFIEIDIKPENPRVQGQILVTLRFLSSINLSAFSGFPDLKLEGVDTVIEALGERKQYQIKRGNRQYLVIERHLALFPQKSGTLKILPFRVEARIAGQNSSMFDPFRRAGQTKRVYSPSKEIQVLATPATHNSRHWLPANEIQITEEWPEDLNNYKAGEPITRTLTIMADGLTSAQLPEFNTQAIQGLKQYTDKPVLQDIKKDTGITGLRQEKIAYIPSASGRYTLPAIKIKWWNTLTQQQQTAQIPEKTIHVLAGTTSPEKTVVDEIKITPPVEKTSTENTKMSSESSFWFVVSILLACGWLITLIYFWLKTRTEITNKITSGQQSISLKQALKKLIQACQSSKPDQCKDALLTWGKARYPDADINSLGKLGFVSNEILRKELELLETTLYGSNNTSWSPDAIASICQSLSKDDTDIKASTSDDLEALYK